MANKLVGARPDADRKKATQRCPCGWLGHPRRGCKCTPTAIAQFAARVSGRVLDRIDIRIEIPALTSEELLHIAQGESSAVVRERVLAARERQRERGSLNARLSHRCLERHCAPHPAGRRLIADVMDRGGVSARGVHHALRVARTIADLASEATVSAIRLEEALQYQAHARSRHSNV